jgi:hypothetical protein
MGRDGWLRRRRRRRVGRDAVVPLPDSLPRTGLIAEPVRVASLAHAGTERLEDGRDRVTFVVEVRAADGARCPAVAVEARVEGPERSRTVAGATDLFGRIRFRMAGPPGTYRCTVTDVAAGGLAWDHGDALPAAEARVPSDTGAR